MDNKERKSNFELLRIILIIMVILLHYCNADMGGLLANVAKGSINYYLAIFMESLSIISVNVFILITGYFMNNNKEIKVSKILNLIYLTVFYGILIYTIWIIILKNPVTITSIKTFVFSILNRWFIITYIILYLLIPYINKFIKTLDKKNFKNLLLILLLFFYVWPTIFTNITISDRGYGIINFITLYLIGAFIKIYYSDFKSFSKSAIIYFVCVIGTVLLSLVSISRAFQYNSIFNLIGSIAFFLMFKSINVKHSTIINKLATYTFSVYIIHENELISKYLYQKVFNTSNYWNDKFLLLNMLITIVGIYIICVIIEKIRRMILSRFFDDKINNIKFKV